MEKKEELKVQFVFSSSAFKKPLFLQVPTFSYKVLERIIKSKTHKIIQLILLGATPPPL